MDVKPFAEWNVHMATTSKIAIPFDHIQFNNCENSKWTSNMLEMLLIILDYFMGVKISNLNNYHIECYMNMRFRLHETFCSITVTLSYDVINSHVKLWMDDKVW